MLTPDEELEMRANPEMPPCAKCEHPFDSHGGTYGCEWEYGDEWVTGNQASGPTVLIARGQCGCKRYEPADLESSLQDEGKI